MGSNTGLTSGRRKCKAVRSARNIVTLLEVPWLSIVVVGWFVSLCLVTITQRALLLPLLRQGVAAACEQVITRVANPSLGGGQGAVLRLHVRFLLHATVASYSSRGDRRIT